MPPSQRWRLLPIDLPNNEAARALAEVLAQELAAKKGRTVEIVVTSEDGDEVCAHTEDVSRH